MSSWPPVRADKLEAAAEAVRAAGARAIAVPCDVATRDGVDRLVAATRDAFGGADILINNAGTGSNETIMDAPDEKWQGYWDLHVMAAIRLARGLVPSMRERGGGVILNNASICAAQPLWYEPIYNVTKSALVMASKTMSTEFIKDNIRVNAVNLGFVLTPDWIKTAKQLTADTGGDWEGYIADLAKANAPIGRFASPEEAADFFVFLCSVQGELLGGLHLFRRWRHAQDDLSDGPGLDSLAGPSCTSWLIQLASRTTQFYHAVAARRDSSRRRRGPRAPGRTRRLHGRPRLPAHGQRRRGCLPAPRSSAGGLP